MVNIFFKLSMYVRRVLDFIVPPFCASCSAFLNEHSIFCDGCQKRIQPVVSKEIKITASHSMKVFAVGFYQEPLSSLIIAKNWSNRTAASQLGELVCNILPIKHIPCDVLVPIPLHWTRFSWRGYNQADEIARAVKLVIQKPVVHMLTRSRRTPYQTALAYEDREKNVQGVFAFKRFDADMYCGKHIVLVDDVMTSGSTLRIAAKELLRLKPASISAIVVARSK